MEEGKNKGITLVGISYWTRGTRTLMEVQISVKWGYFTRSRGVSSLVSRSCFLPTRSTPFLRCFVTQIQTVVIRVRRKRKKKKERKRGPHKSTLFSLMDDIIWQQKTTRISLFFNGARVIIVLSSVF